MDIATILKGFAGFVWLGWLAILVFVMYNAAKKTPIKSGRSIVIIVLVFALVMTTVSSGLVFTNPEERGVVISAVQPQGYRSEALQPGLSWIIPFAENVVFYPISQQTYTMSIAPTEGAIRGDDSIAARTLDGQEIYVDASVIFSIDPTKVVSVHIYWQNTYVDLIRSQVRGIIRDAVSQYSVNQVVSSKRFEMVQSVEDNLRIKLEENGLILYDFVLRNIAFSPEYAASVEQKQIAEQQAQQAELVVEQKKQEAEQARQVAKGAADAAVTRAKGEAEARLIQAEAEAKSLQLIAEVLKNNPNLLNYQYITNLSDDISVMLVPNNTPFILPFPQTDGSGATTTLLP
ncbi:MAG: SPFH domain-containing protein [Anaerolineaceae bacterium]|jgi:regulator of protease activity HflC (stomatin/prohibitin superfamily)|nr:SPFH domain-containing protein [Anaerolineaceae bacterium]